MNATLDTKLAAIEAAMKAQTLTLSRIIGDNNMRSMEPKTFDRARDLWQTIRERKEADGQG